MSLLELHRENNNDSISIAKAAIVCFGPRTGAPGTRVELISGNIIDVAEGPEAVAAAYTAAD